MPWSTPKLSEVRKLTRDNFSTALRGAVLIPNSILRVMADAMSALAHMALLYIDWAAKQLLPDTAEAQFLLRHGEIWLTNADGSKGKKAATYADGTIDVTGTNGTPLPMGTQFIASNGMLYETTAQATVGTVATPVPVRALTAGAAGNQVDGVRLNMMEAIAGVDGVATVVSIDGGTDIEDDEALRARVLDRIQEPPMGGDQADYVKWAKAVAGVTRAWCYPNEMGIGTVTVRFMMDVLRAGAAGFPTGDDVDIVQMYIDTVRPVTLKDFFIEAPIPHPIDLRIVGLEIDNADVRASIEVSLQRMLLERAKPGQTIYASWVSEAVSSAVGEDHHTLEYSDAVMESVGHMPVLGTISYG